MNHLRKLGLALFLFLGLGLGLFGDQFDVFQ
jgi:hypothetical protein